MAPARPDKPAGARAQLGCTIVDRPGGLALLWAATIGNDQADVIAAGAIAQGGDQCSK